MRPDTEMNIHAKRLLTGLLLYGGVVMLTLAIHWVISNESVIVSTLTEMGFIVVLLYLFGFVILRDVGADE